MNDDPRQIAAYLVEEHGPEGALDAVRNAIAAAHAENDNYRLSVWREVRQALRNMPEEEDGEVGAATT